MSAVRSDDLVRAPHPRLRPFVGDYIGYDISGVPAGTHLGLPSGALTFIVAIDRPLCQVDPRAEGVESFDVPVAGLPLTPARIRHSGTMAGIQISFGLLAPHAIFALSAVELAHHTWLLGGHLAAARRRAVRASRQCRRGRFDAVDKALL